MKHNNDNHDRDTLACCATFATDWEAHIAAGVLEENGIPSTIDNEIFSSIYPIGFNSIGGIRLMVWKRDLDRARRLLAVDW